MLLECGPGPIIIDGVPVAKDLRLNVDPKTRRFRLKAVGLSTTGQEQTVDITADDVGKPEISISGASASITIRGHESVTGVRFEVSIKYQALRKEWMMAGSYDHIPIRYQGESLAKMIVKIKEVVIGHQNKSL